MGDDDNVSESEIGQNTTLTTITDVGSAQQDATLIGYPGTYQYGGIGTTYYPWFSENVKTND